MNFIKDPNIWISYGYGEGFAISPAPSNMFNVPLGLASIVQAVIGVTSSMEA